MSLPSPVPAPSLRNRALARGSEAFRAASLRVVPRMPARAPRLPFVILVGLVLLAGIIGLLMFNTSMQQASFTVSSLEREAAALESREQTLTMELDDLNDPQRVAQAAEDLGMVRQSAPAFLTLDGRVLGDPTPAVAEDQVRITSRAPAKPAALRPQVDVVEVALTPEQFKARLKAERKAQRQEKKAQQAAAQPVQ